MGWGDVLVRIDYNSIQVIVSWASLTPPPPDYEVPEMEEEEDFDEMEMEEEEEEPIITAEAPAVTTTGLIKHRVPLKYQ